uniref:Mast cell-expressed membrane protein 1 n=1 Tax=Panthera tigris altaica TaxID=74533 RepID=A0A8C9JR79_PANTA
MQAAAFKDKKQRVTSPASAPVPAWSRPAPDSAQVPRWLHRATLSLYILLALFCIVLLALVLVKNSEVSQELRVVKRELQNGKVSISGQQCQEEQKQGWSSIQQLVTEARQVIDVIKTNVHIGNEKTKLHEISKVLEKKPQPRKLG